MRQIWKNGRRLLRLNRTFLEKSETMEDITFFVWISSPFAGIDKVVIDLQHLDVGGFGCGAFALIVPLLAASEARDIVEKDAVDARDGGSDLGEGHLDLLISGRRVGTSRVTIVRTAPYITINRVKGFRKVGGVLVCTSREMVLEVVDEVAIPSSIGSFDESDREGLAARDVAEQGEFLAHYRVDILFG